MRSITSSLIILSLLVSGCAGGAGPIYSASELEGPAKGLAQVVIYHPSGEFTGSVKLGSGPDVKVNGKVVCSLPNSSFFVTSVQPGETHISSTKMFAVGTSILDINTAANTRYYVRITWNGTKILAGEIGEIATQGQSYRSGPFVIEHVDERSANAELQSLRMADGC